MPTIINFTIPKTLERRVTSVIKKNGFASKAEFFRFAAMRFVMEETKKFFASEDERMDYLIKEITKVVKTKFNGKKLPSAKEQLARLL